MIFHHVPSRPLDRHPTSHRLKHFQISNFTRGTQIFDIAGREPKFAHWVSFFGQNISKLVLPKYFGGHCYLYSNLVMYTPPYNMSCAPEPQYLMVSDFIRCHTRTALSIFVLLFCCCKEVRF